MPCFKILSSHNLTIFRLLSIAVGVFARDNNALLSFCLVAPGDWYAQGCYKENKKKIFKKFRKFRIAGLVDKCKEEAERLHLDVFGVGVRTIDLLFTATNATNIF